MTSRARTMRARAMRRAMTKHEMKLWVHLRGAQMGGCSFRRQHSVGPYYLDFYCPAAMLAVELDGSQHGTAQARDYDDDRAAFLIRKGIAVLRFWNHELDNNLDGVLEAIQRALPTAPSRAIASRGLPLSGGGL